ncbi:MAG: hypothetical protein MH204_05430, partial [Fimbriimonadaceae bacterium]|nr:hypothetical protein [Fimbriimonadaceae bacterium]
MTLKAQEAVQSAQSLASDLQNQTIEPEHLLAGMVRDVQGVPASLLGRIGVSAEDVRRSAESALSRNAKVSGAALHGSSFGSRTVDVFNRAFDLAGKMKDEYVSTEHLLLSLLSDGGQAGRILKDAGVREP